MFIGSLRPPTSTSNLRPAPESAAGEESVTSRYTPCQVNLLTAHEPCITGSTPGKAPTTRPFSLFGGSCAAARPHPFVPDEPAGLPPHRSGAALRVGPASPAAGPRPADPLP